MKPMLLIDGKNCLYRAVYANSPNRDTQHPMTVVMRFIGSWVKKFDPSSVHVFWDCPRRDIWRMDVLPTYKDRPTSGREDVGQEMGMCYEVARELFPVLGVRQYNRKGMEADDLVYSACRVFNPHPIIACSSDSDYLQMPYAFQHVTLYNPMENKQIQRPDYNPAIFKALVGDKSDAVDGFEGIGVVRGRKLVDDPILRHEFLSKRGIVKYTTNMLLVDLSLNPHLLENDHYVIKTSINKVVFDHAQANRIITKHKIKGLLNSSNDSILPFKHLVSSEGEN